jgi:hypothetical protein
LVAILIVEQYSPLEIIGSGVNLTLFFVLPGAFTLVKYLRTPHATLTVQWIAASWLLLITLLGSVGFAIVYVPSALALTGAAIARTAERFVFHRSASQS